MDQPHVAVRAPASTEALELIYRDRFAQFVRVAQGITRSRETAVDAVQEAFASLLRNREAYRGDGPLEAWVWRAVVNSAQRSFRLREVEPLDAAEAIEQERAPGDDVRALVAALPERQRLVLFLRYYADLDYREIAEILGVTVGTVSASLHAARASLRRALESEEVRT